MSNNRWKNYVVNIGEVKQKTRVNITFESYEDLDISRVDFGCSSCTKFIDYKDRKLTIQYSGEEYPRHLIGSHHQPQIDKNLTVYLNDGNKDKLRFIGKMKR